MADLRVATGEFDEGKSDDAVVTFIHPATGSVTLVGESPEEYVFSLIRKGRNFYESDLLDVIEHLGLPTGVAVDVGAHIGNHSLFFARALGLETVAFEPRSQSVALIQRNIEINGVSHLVTPVHMALGAKSSKGRLEQRIEGNTGSFRVIEDPAGEIEIGRLDDQLPDTARVVLIKIDVEGDEPEVVLGGLATIERCRPVLTVETHSGPRLDRVARLLRPFDYSPIAVSGRSDNYTFVSRSAASPVEFDRADRRAQLAWDRQKTRLVEAGFRDLGSRLRSLGVQSGQQSEITVSELAKIKGALEELLEIAGGFQDRLAGQRAVIERYERAIAIWRYEYERLSRSRALRAGSRVRAFLSNLGLSPPRPVRSAAEVEDAIEAAESEKEA